MSSCKTIERGPFDCSGLQKFVVRPGERRLARQDGGNRRRELLQVRQQLEADTVARNADVGVRGILPETQAVLPGVGAQLGARDLEQRPDDDAGARPDPGQTGRPRTANQPQQEGFRLILETVADGDGPGVERCGRVVQKAVARGARRVLDRAPALPRHAAHVAAPDDDRQAERSRQLPAEELVGVRLGAAQLVIEMSRTGNDERDRAARASAARGAAPRSRRPPDSATSTRPPGGSMPCFRMVRRARDGTDILKRWKCRSGKGHAAAFSLLPSPVLIVRIWCRCRDLNPGRRGYEPRALTN